MAIDLEIFPDTPAGRRSRWTFEQLQRLSAEGNGPTVQDLEEYHEEFLNVVPLEELVSIFQRAAEEVASTTSAKVEVNRAEHFSLILKPADGSRESLYVHRRP